MEIYKIVVFVLCCTADALGAASGAGQPMASADKCKLVLFAGPKESNKIDFPFSVDGLDRLFRDDSYDPNRRTVFLVDLNEKQADSNIKIMRAEYENHNLILVDLTSLAPLVDSLQADINESTIGQDLLPTIGAELSLGEILAEKVSRSLGAQVKGQIAQGRIVPVTGHDPTSTGPFYSILSVNTHVSNKKDMKGKFGKKSY